MSDDHDLEGEEEVDDAVVEQLVQATVNMLDEGHSEEDIVAHYVESGMEAEVASNFVSEVKAAWDKQQFHLGKFIFGMVILAPGAAAVGVFLFYLLAEIAGYRLIRYALKGLKRGGFSAVVSVVGIFEGIILILVGLWSDLVSIGVL